MMTRAAIAAALLCGAPAIAASTTVLPGSAAMAQTPAEPGVDAFYRERAQQPLWLSQPGAAETLIGVLQRASLDGFAAGPQLAATAQDALRYAGSGDAHAKLQADRLLSSAWVRYVRALRTPPSGMTFADPSLMPAMNDARTVLHDAARSHGLADHVRQVSSVNPVYASLRDAAWNEMQGSGAMPDRRVLGSLERARFMPKSNRYVLVDAASARLLMIEDGQVRDSMKVIVGKSSSQTPMLASNIYYATLNPYWNVPTDLARKLIAPRVLADGMSYLKDRGYEVLSSYDENADIVDPKQVDWKAVADGRLQLRIRQRPGPANSMGHIKFSFRNNAGIYLHDTPNKQLFSEEDRGLSNGCIRLEDADRLGRWLLGGEPQGEQTPEQHIALPRPVPVYVTYLTAQSDDGRIALLSDSYGRDRSTGAALASASY